MYIDRTLPTRSGGGIGVTGYSDGARLELTIWEPWANSPRRVKWLSVSLTAPQAIRLANVLQTPPEWERIKVQDGSRPYRTMWQVFALRHGNGVHPGAVGVCRPYRKSSLVTLGITNRREPQRSKARTSCWWSDHEIRLTGPQLRVLCGLLYLWAGARLTGTRRVTTTTRKDVLYTEEPTKAR